MDHSEVCEGLIPAREVDLQGLGGQLGKAFSGSATLATAAWSTLLLQLPGHQSARFPSGRLRRTFICGHAATP
eukprot:8131316-Prorocentrum_lima.AAC.1